MTREEPTRPPSRTAPVLAAVVLAVLTLSVFFMLREYGPESVLRKWHRAAINAEPNLLARTTTTTSSPVSVQILASRLQEFARMGAQYQLLGVERSPGRVICQVQYTFPNRNVVVPMLWVVDKQDARWRVNTDETVVLIRRAMGLGGSTDFAY